MDQDKELVAKEANDGSDKKESTKIVLSYLHDLVCLIAVVMILFSFCLRVVVVSGPSMENTLYNGDCLLVLGRIFYPEPKAGDIVVISKESFDDGTPIIKRVIATAGQWVDIDSNTGIVYVDGNPLTEGYTTSPTTVYKYNNMEFPLQVEEGCVFVLGDNRENSKDSRSLDIGMVDTREVLGKAIFLFFPGANLGNRNLSRIGVLYR